MSDKHPNCYRLVLTEKQVQAVSAACELLSRIYIGQIEQVADCYMDHPKYSEIRTGCEELHKLITGIPNGGPGIFNTAVNNQARIVWEIYGTIRQLLAYEHNPEGGSSVYFRDPLPSSGEPMPQVEPHGERPDPRPIKGRMRDELIAEIGTDDIHTALEFIRAWKECAREHNQRITEELR